MSPLALVHSGTALDVALILDALQLAELRSEWLDLWSGLVDATPFESPDWLLPWWRHYGEGPMLCFAFRRKEKLVGVAPLYIYRESASRPPRLFLMGTGNSDYLDVICNPDFASECAKTLLSEIQARSNLWDECSFQQLRPNSPLLLARDQVSPCNFDIDKSEPCPALDLHAFDASFAMLKRASYYRRRIEKEGSFSIEEATQASFDEIFDALERLHEGRWRDRGLSGAFGAARDRQFHRSAAGAFLNASMLKLYAARFNGKIIAALYAFRHRKRTYFYLTGFDPDYRHFSIGTIILGHAIEQARREDSYIFDFLRGQEAYKYRWGARDQITFRMRLRNSPHEARV
jgi:CelD/BcsL family acetyltransferase involved in cellulose biosynthesis